MTAELRLINSSDEFEKLENVWNDLLSQSPSDNYFMRWEWLWNWWRIYAREDDELSIFIISNDGEITGIAPFYLRKVHIGKIWPLKRLMFLGTQEESEGDVGSEYMDIICREELTEKFVDMLYKTIRDKNICDDIFLGKIDTSSSTYGHFQTIGKRLGFLTLLNEDFVCPYIKLPATWEEYLGNITSSMRQEIRHVRNRQKKVGVTVLSRVEKREEISAGLGQLVRLHEERWKSKGQQGAFSHPQFLKFHENIMPVMLKNGHLELVLLSEGGVGKVTFYHILYNNKIYFYQSGVDTSDNKLSFGTLLHSYCIEQAISRGISEYDFLRKGRFDNYKEQFAKNKRFMADLYIVPNRAVQEYVRARELARSIYHWGKRTLSVQRDL